MVRWLNTSMTWELSKPSALIFADFSIDPLLSYQRKGLSENDQE